MSLYSSEADLITPLVSKILTIRDLTWGSPQLKYTVRYRGRLNKDSILAFDQLNADLKAHALSPLFRTEDELHTITLIDRVPEPVPTNPKNNIILFLLTVFSMLIAGASYVYEGDAESFLAFYGDIIFNLGSGIPFAASLLAILLAHEFGHYLVARYHKTPVTLPFFIPLPLPLSFGTLGAFIRMMAPPKNKRQMLDIGIAGPLAGLVVAIPILLVGISLSEVSALPTEINEASSLMLEGNSLFYLAAKYWVKGQLLPAPINYQGVAPFIYWVKYFFTGYPAPLGGLDIQMHSMAWAGWAGLLVTALNLIPVGQLDGGHILYVLFDKNARKVLPFVLGFLIFLGFFWRGWWLWAFMISFMGQKHAEPMDQITELNPGRKLLSVIGLVILLLIFTPVPLQLLAGT